MSIVTKRGDNGETDLLFGKRIRKDAPRMRAVGAIDELNAVLGLARAHDPDAKQVEVIDHLQGLLVGLMGELAVLPEDGERYGAEGFPAVSAEDVEWAGREAAAIEESGVSFAGWARPGARGGLVAPHLDLARTVCRREEREVLRLGPEVPNPEIGRFLNRCSDLLWLLARKAEEK